MAFDVDPDLAQATRHKFYDMAAAEKATGGRLPLHLPLDRPCREGRHEIPADPGGLESGDLIAARELDRDRPSRMGGLICFGRQSPSNSRFRNFGNSCTCIFLPAWLGCAPSRSGARVKRKSHGHPAQHRRHRRQPSQGELYAQDRQRAGQAGAGYAQARRRHPARHFVLQSGSGSDSAGRLAGVPRKAAEVERRAVRDARIQSLDPRRAEERHRRRIAALRQELVPRQADRHRQQFAGPARRRQRRQASAEHPAGHCRPDHGAAGNLPERRRRRLRRQGRSHQGSRCRRCCSNISTPLRPSSRSRTNRRAAARCGRS